MTREVRLAKTFVEVADTLVADFDIVDLHTLLAERCVQIFDIDAAAVMVVNANKELRLMAASDDGTRASEIFEVQANEGPSLECFESGEQVTNQDLKVKTELWPRFATAALSQGFSIVHALPMRLRSDAIGVLNLFQTAGRLTRDDLESAQALADIATIAILHHRARIDAKDLNDQLDQALTSRIVIEQAKGILAAKNDLSMDEAFAGLRDHARRNNRRLADVARSVVDGTMSDTDRIATPPTVQ